MRTPYPLFWRSDDPLKPFLADASGLGKFPPGAVGAPVPASQNLSPAGFAMPAMVPAAPASEPPNKPSPITEFTRPHWSVAKGWKAGAFGRSVANKGVGVMRLGQNVTQAQVATPLITAGFKPDTANSMANAAVTFVHSHGFNALAVGFTVAVVWRLSMVSSGLVGNTGTICMLQRASSWPFFFTSLFPARTPSWE